MIGNTRQIAIAWPSSTPRLKPARARSKDQPASASGVSASAKPSPCTNPNAKVRANRRHNRPAPNMFSSATQMIDSAISGSTTADGACTSPRTASDKVMLCARVNIEAMPSTRQKFDAPISSANKNSKWS